MANLERGFRRLTWVVSLVLSIPLIALGAWVGVTVGDASFASVLILFGAGAFALSWAVFFSLRWVARGFREAKKPADEEGNGNSDDEAPASWWRRLLGPFVRPFRFSYYSRPHCRFPFIHKDSWGAIHIVCGAPPVDTIDVKGLETVLNQLKSSNDVMSEIMPQLLSATMDENGVVPVCAGHMSFTWEKIGEMFDGMSDQEQGAFKEWLKTQKQGGAQEGK